MYNKPSKSTLILSTSKFHQMGDQVAARTEQNLVSLILPVQEGILKTQVAEETWDQISTVRPTAKVL